MGLIINHTNNVIYQALFILIQLLYENEQFQCSFFVIINLDPNKEAVKFKQYNSYNFFHFHSYNI